MKTFLSLLTLTALITLAGCNKAQSTADTLRKEIAEFQAAPSEEKQAIIEQHFAKLETEIAELQKKGSEKAAGLREQLTALQESYQSAKIAKAIRDGKKALQGLGEAFKEGAKGIGEALHGTNSPD